VLGIDALAEKMISMSGIWGGLRRTTEDHFSLSLQAPYWPDERIVLHLPDKQGNPSRYFQALVVEGPVAAGAPGKAGAVQRVKVPPG
jgi:hypothetical protein